MLSGESVSDTTFIPERVGRGDLDQGLGVAALGLVAPAVRDRPNGVDAERGA